jgi:hypothetical protein
MQSNIETKESSEWPNVGYRMDEVKDQADIESNIETPE